MFFSMRNEGTSRKRLLALEDTPKERRQALKDATETTTTLCHLETHNPFSDNFNNITRWLNLSDLNLSNSGIVNVPMQLGNLPFLQRLNLSQNSIGSYPYRWLWLEQANIRRTLLFLDISKNSLIEFPRYITKLNALTELKISRNRLKTLPYSIGNIQSLKILDISYNSLVHLPGGIYHLQLQTINVSRNPFLGLSASSFSIIEKYQVVPSFVQFAARALVEQRPENIRSLPNVIVEHIDTVECCYFCTHVCTIPYVYSIMLLVHLNQLADNVIAIGSQHPLQKVLFELYYCYGYCKSDETRN